jgi:hypothetical protein
MISMLVNATYHISYSKFVNAEVDQVQTLCLDRHLRPQSHLTENKFCLNYKNNHSDILQVRVGVNVVSVIFERMQRTLKIS